MRRQHRVRFLTFGLSMIGLTVIPFALFCVLKLLGFHDNTAADFSAEAVVMQDDGGFEDTDGFGTAACRLEIISLNVTINIPSEKCLRLECGEGCTLTEFEEEDEEAEVVDAVPVPEEEFVLPWYRGDNVYDFVHWSAIVSFTITISIIGVMSSVVSRSGARGRAVNINSVSDVVSVLFFSSVAGVLLLMLCIGGFLGGNLFPSFEGGIKNFGFNSWSGLDFRGPEWGKLAVWAYISGFYERFIPGLFDRILEQNRDMLNNGASSDKPQHGAVEPPEAQPGHGGPTPA